MPQLPLPGRDPRQLAAVEPRAAASRATIDRDSGPSRLDQPSRTARTLHRCFLGRIIASSGSTYVCRRRSRSVRGSSGSARLGRADAASRSCAWSTATTFSSSPRSSHIPRHRSQTSTTTPTRVRSWSNRPHRGQSMFRAPARAGAPNKKTPRGDSPRRVSIRGSHPSRRGRVAVRTTVLTTSPDRGAIYSPFIEGGVYGLGHAGVKRIRAGCAECEATESPTCGGRADRTALRHVPAMERPFPAAHPAWLLSRCQRTT